MAIGQMARSNRPHKLTLAPFVTLIELAAVAALVLGGLRLNKAFRGRSEVPIGPWHWMLAALLPVVIFVAVLFLVVAAGTAVEVIRA